jgi:hypothetical protein
MNNLIARNFYSQLRSLLFGLLFFFILIDSGGPLGLRFLSAGFAAAVGYVVFIKNIKTAHNLDFIILTCVCALLFLGGLFSAAVNQISIYIYINLVVFLITLPMWAISLQALSVKEFMSGLVCAGNIFAIAVIVTFVSFFFDIPYLSEHIADYLKDFPGSFRPHDLFGYPYFIVYFQSLLTFVPLAIAAYLLKKRRSMFLFLLILVVALSRYGVFSIILIMLSLNKFGEKKVSKIIVCGFLPFLICFLVFVLISTLNNYSGYEPNFESGNVRIGHAISTFLSFDISNFLIGQGPGSFFYSLGRMTEVDNTEISYLELLRKYGVFWWLLFFIYINWIFFKLYKLERYELIIIIFSFIFVAASNPVLTSMSFSVLFGYSIAVIIKFSSSKKRLQKD